MWSNSNIFRAVTYLVATWCKQDTPDGIFDKDRALTKENIAIIVSMILYNDGRLRHVHSRHTGARPIDSCLCWATRVLPNDWTPMLMH
mmetsp:Transcript_25446/g.39068  ORF Transcript_25446/g.39068 Transcript_25446/m.39068 type:complete len:88 (-) Transcript_25446:491-754(-)